MQVIMINLGVSGNDYTRSKQHIDKHKNSNISYCSNTVELGLWDDNNNTTKNPKHTVCGQCLNNKNTLQDIFLINSTFSLHIISSLFTKAFGSSGFN